MYREREKSYDRVCVYIDTHMHICIQICIYIYIYI